MTNKSFAFIPVLIAAMSCPAVAEETFEDLYEAARQEGQLTWCSSQYSTATAEAMGRAFTEKYPGVNVNVIKATSQVIFQRINEDLRSGISQCDVFSSTDAGHALTLKEQGHLERFEPENESRIIGDFQKIDPDGYFYITSVGLVLLTYNTDLVSEEEAPKSWTDLLDPKWNGRIVLASPAFSGAAGAWAVNIRKAYGSEYFEGLLANDPLLTRSIDNTVTSLNSGERQVAVGWSASSLLNAQRGNPIGFSYPSDGVLVVAGASGIMAQSGNKNAAKLFVEYLLSEENSAMIIEEAEIPLRPEVDPPAGLRPLSDFTLVRLEPRETIEGIPVVREEWRDIDAQ